MAHGQHDTPISVASKYDYVKVRVWAGEHPYVLSRFMLTRMLTAVMVDEEAATRIALDIKKRMVSQGDMNLSQEELEVYIRETLKAWGYEKYIRRFFNFQRLQFERIPFVVLVAGVFPMRKSHLAMRLAYLVNIPNVLGTDMVHAVVKAHSEGGCIGLDSRLVASLCALECHEDDPALGERAIELFKRESSAVTKGCQPDIEKALDTGKAVIVEGSRLDFSAFLSVGNGFALRMSQKENSNIIVPILLTVKQECNKEFVQALVQSVPANKTQMVVKCIHSIDEYLRTQVKELGSCGISPTVIEVGGLTEKSDDTVAAMHAAVVEALERAMGGADGAGMNT